MSNPLRVFHKSVLFTTVCILFLFLFSCKKKSISADDPGALPEINTMDLSEINANSAKSGCIVRATGRSELARVGICWSTNSQPTTNDNVADLKVIMGPQTFPLTNLEQNTTYYVRAFAGNGLGVAYGEEKIFTTSSTWQLVNNTVTPQPNFSSYGKMVALGNDLYFHDGPNRMFKSSDNGFSWQSFNTGLSGMTASGLLAVYQNSVIILTSNGKSYACGGSNNWVQITPNFPNSPNYTLNSFVVKDNVIIACGYGLGMFKCAFNGASWTMPSGNTFSYSNALAIKNSTLFLGLNNSPYLYTSSDNGNNWIMADPNTSGLNSSIRSIFFNGDDSYVVAYNGCYLSTDNGINWSLQNVRYDLYNLTFAGSAIYGRVGSGCMISFDKGANWADFNTGIFSSYYMSDIVANNGYLFTIVYNGSSYRLYRRRIS